MSYCMFQNTYIDLKDCVGELEYADTLKDLELSNEEKSAMIRMYDLCNSYMVEFDRLYKDSEDDE